MTATPRGRSCTEYTKSEALLRHALAVEAAVRCYARLDGEDEAAWGNVALLHDFDYEVHPTLDKHPQDGGPILRERGYPGVVRPRHPVAREPPRPGARDAAREDAVRLRRAGRLRSRLRARAAGRHRDARAVVGQEEAEAEVVRRRRQPRRRARGPRADRPRPGRAHHERDRRAAPDRARARPPHRRRPIQPRAGFVPATRTDRHGRAPVRTDRTIRAPSARKRSGVRPQNEPFRGQTPVPKRTIRRAESR